MDYTKYVNIDIGTNSEYRESNGNTLPLVQYPFGNQAYCFQSNKNDNGWFYKPNANYTEGIRVTNQPSPWLGDYGHITILPFNGKYDVDLHSSLLDKKHTPYKMSGLIKRYDTKFQLVPTKSGARIDIENNSKNKSKILIDCHSGINSYRLENDILYLTVCNIPDSFLINKYRKIYAIKFDANIVGIKSYVESTEVDTCTSENLQIEIEVDSAMYKMDIVSSYIDFDFASNHLSSQVKRSTADLIEETKETWNKCLSTVEIKSESSEKEYTRFYSNMYRIFCYPHFISEEDIDGNQVYYNFKTEMIDSGFMIADVGFWDTYRTTMPLYRELIPSIYKQMIDAILNYYESYGWLPRWLAPYERGIMPSTLVDSVVASAIEFEMIDEKRVSVAIEALLKNADVVSEDKLFGREHLFEYKKYGYVPAECSGETVSLSLDNYYSDYAIYKALKKVNHTESSRFKTRCEQYKILFNENTKLFERVDKNLKFDEFFNPDDWGYDFCESSAWQNSFNIFHDTDGLIKLIGSEAEVEERLDLIFNSNPNYTVGKYGFEIHEMTEYARITDLGYFAISNQPSFNLPFWYLKIGKEQKFEEIIKRTLKYFTTENDGYPGDEDNGSLAAWFILVNLGIYPFCPVDGMIEFKSQFEYKINKI